MAFNLLESVKGLFTSDLVSQTASSLGENENNIRKALGGAVPASLVGMLNKAGSGEATDLLDISRQASRSGILGNIKGLLGGGLAFGNILNLTNGLFGDKLNNVIRTIANFAGIKETSAASVVNLAAPAALAAVGREASTTNMSTSGLVSMLANQKDSIINSVPSGLNLAGALGLGSLGEIGTKISNAVSGVIGGVKSGANYATEAIGQATRKRNWAWPLLLLALLAVALWLLLGRRNNKPEPMSVAPVDTTSVVSDPVVTAPPERESYRVKLPDGVELDALRGGIEEKLVLFLGSDWKSLTADSLKKVWFDFDDLNFETGSSRITPASMRQVNNIVAIMKAFPNVKFKVGGYTDKVGNDADNKKLSQDRADAVALALTNAGADKSRVTGAEGYGEEYATVPENASDEERRVDRRISLSVRK